MRRAFSSPGVWGFARVALAMLAALPVLAGTTACSSSESAAAEPTPAELPPPPPLACEPGETAENGACVAAGIVACPTGTSGTDGVCKPTFPSTCKAGTAKILGETACVAIGHTSCPAGTVTDASGWGCAALIPASCAGATRAAPGGACLAIGTCPSALPAGSVRLVDDDFTAGQIDATHFASIGAALAGAPSGTVLSVQPGTYRETLIVPAGIAVVGTCAGDVVIEPAPAATAAAIAVSSGAVTLRGLTLRGAPIGLSVTGANVTADALVVEQSRGVGVDVQSGSLSLKSSVVRETKIGPTRDDAIGIYAIGGTTTLDDVTVDGSAGTGLSAWRTSKVVAHGLTVVRTTKPPNGSFGWGIDVESGGSFEGTRVVVAGASFAGVAATDTGSRVRLDDSIVTDITAGTFGPPGGPSLGAGLAATERAVIEAHRVTLAKTAGSSVIVAGGASAVLDAMTARDGGAATDAIGGLYVSGAKVTLTSSVVTSAVHNGIQSLDGATISIDGLLVRDTKTNADTSSGIGVLASTKGTLEGKRLTLERNAIAQLAALDEATVKLEALAVIDARGGPADNFPGSGIGVLADKASRVTLTNAYVGQNKFLGVSLRRGSSLEAIGFVIDGVELVNGDGGFGVIAIEGTTLTLTDFAIRGAHGASIVAGEKDTKAVLTRGTLRDVSIDKNPGLARGLSVQAGAGVAGDRVRMQGMTGTAVYITRASSASFTSCVVDGIEQASDGRFGDAFEVVDGSTLRFDRSVVRNAKGAALVFAGGAGAIGASLIEHNAVGIHVQDGSELAESDELPAEVADHSVTVTRSTRFLENETRIGQGVLPLPQPLPLD